MNKFNRKYVASSLGKKRVNVFLLEKRVAELERLLKVQKRINAHQVQFNEQFRLSHDVCVERWNSLSVSQNKGSLCRWLHRFWAWLAR